MHKNLRNSEFALPQTSQWPRITLVTPTLNQANFIEKTIQSVIEQEYPNLEYIIMDGGSTDGTVDIIKKHSTFFTYWESQKDRGQAHAINKGLARATGDIFNWINSDDFLETGTLFEVARLWNEQHPHLILGCLEQRRIPEGTIDLWPSKGPTRFRDFLGDGTVCCMPQPATFLDRKLMKEQGGLREELICQIDWELYVRLFVNLKGQMKTAHSKKIFAVAILHPKAKTFKVSHRFEEEGRRVLSEIRTKLGIIDKILVTHRLDRMFAQEGITHALKSKNKFSALLKFAAQRPTVVIHRFFWGALRNSVFQ